MRVAITVLGIFGGLMLYDQAYISVRVGQILAGSVLTLFTVGPVVLFACWVLATGLVHQFPAIAVWSFAAGGVVGIYTGIEILRPVIVAWGLMACLLALASTFARREKSADERRAWVNDERLALATTVAIALGRAANLPQAEAATLPSYLPWSGEPASPARLPAPVRGPQGRA